ncbi:MAG: putative selenate ABC transporter substrate-binding protein [Betaproteobacteria bacterium]|nr:putative selenate ABC transporter substrate-binding protein [Betaproteobacteria bacterium]
MHRRDFVKTAAILLTVATVSVLPQFSIPAFAQSSLKVSAIPDEAPTELQRKFAPLGKYLETEIGMKVEFIPVSDYAAVVEALASRKLDMAWLGGFTFVQARLRTGNANPIIQREEDRVFTSKFIADAASGINSLADLKGKDFTFGSVSSTSGHLMPRYFLQQAKINPEKDFKRVAYSGAHDATALQVESGKVAAGVLNASVWEKLVSEKKVDTTKVKVIYTTPTYFDYNWTVRGDLGPVLVKKLTAAFLKLDAKNPAHKEIMDLQRASRFVPANPDNYKGIESAARAAGLLK